jgi:hypothetical protein
MQNVVIYHINVVICRKPSLNEEAPIHLLGASVLVYTSIRVALIFCFGSVSAYP